MSELLPCPCCESTNLIGGEHPTDCVYCKDCWLRAASPAAWNTRANQLCVVPSVEVIARAVFFCHFASSADAQSMMNKEWGKPSPLMDMVQREATAIHNLLTGEA